MNTFNKVSAYYQMLQMLMHIGSQAVHAISTGKDENNILSKLDAHLASYTATLDNVGAVLLPTAEAVKETIDSTKANLSTTTVTTVTQPLQ